MSDSSRLPVLFGRSSSHFTRVARLFAAELGVAYSFVVVRDLLSTDAADYGGNPALRVPTLETSAGRWFGSLNVCRELARRAEPPRRILWPESLDDPSAANAQELILQAMATEVSLILARATSTEGRHLAKQRTSLLHLLSWLEEHVPRVLDALPAEREPSYLEVTLFCLVTHLEFREVLPVDSYGALGDFCRRFGERPSARATAYRFDE